jgi:thiol-disulfide isomerase/thioredoxin
MIVDLTNETFTPEVEENFSPCAVLFHKPTCGPCKVVHAPYKEVEQRFGLFLRMFKLNAVTFPQIAEEEVGLSFPTLVVYDRGVPFGKHIGTFNEQTLEAFLRRQMDGLMRKRQLEVKAKALNT